MPRAKNTSNSSVTPPPGPVPASLLAGSRYHEELFWRGFRASAVVHAGLVVAVIVASLVMPAKPKVFLPSIRVDLVGLPSVKKSDLSKTQADEYSDLSKKLSDASKNAKKLLEQAKKAAPEPALPPDPSEMSLKKEKDKSKPRTDNQPVEAKKSERKDLKSAIERIKALAALENESASKPNPTNKASAQIAGNQVSRGNSLTGQVADDTNSFISSMQNRLRDNWNLPVWLSKQNLNAKVVVFLDRKGFVSNAIIAKSSGNPQFDEYCLKTVRMAQPFGTPPGEIVNEGLTLGFPL